MSKQSGSLSPNCPTSQLNCCIISELVVPWTYGGFEVITAQKFLKDRLAVLAKIKGQTELLGISAIDSGSGEHQKEAIEELISNFGLEDKVQCLCFDTTSANKGKAKGACSRIIMRLLHPMLLTACRTILLSILLPIFGSFIQAVILQDQRIHYLKFLRTIGMV